MFPSNSLDAKQETPFMSSLFATGPQTTHSVSKFAWSQSY